MKPITKNLLNVVAWLLLTAPFVQAERADAVYRDGVFFNITAHAALLYRYDNQNSATHVIHSAGGGSYAANSVRTDSWSNFLSSNNFLGAKCPANLSKGVRDAIISDALDQLNAHYWGYGLLTYCYERPNTSPGSGDGCFRCDFLVEWCYEQNGYDVCNDALLFAATPTYQMGRMADAVQTAPTVVAVTYPASTSQSAPTKTSSTTVTFTATASDTHSGLSYNKPYIWNISWKRCDGLWDAASGVRGDSSYSYTLQKGLLYGVGVSAADNGGVANSANLGYASWTYIARPFVISSSAGSGGSISPSGNSERMCNESISFTASPNSCYTVDTWYVNGVAVQTGGDNYTLSSIQADRTVQVTFKQITYSISCSASPSGGGSTSGCGTKTCGSSVTVSATPNSCYTFANWTEGGTVVSTSPSYSFTSAGNRALVANFSQTTYTVSTSSSPSGGGTTGGGGTKACGTTVTVTATANTGYSFVNWTEGGVVVSTSASYSFTASANRTLVANFSQTTYTVSTSASPTAGGSISGGGSYASGSTVTVTATPASCYQFANWTENGTVVSTSASYSFTASANRTLVANFSQTTYTVSTSSSPSGGGTTGGGGTKACGTTVTVTATANTGYSFVNWTEGGVVVSTSASYSFTASTNRTLVANFTATTTAYTINTSSSPAAGGSTSGGGSYGSGSTATVTATPASCYQFVNWTESGVVVSTSASYSFTASANRTLVANFTQPSYTISTSSSPTAGGATSGGGGKVCGASVTVTAVANSGYNFVRWTENGTVVSTSASYTFTVSANRTLVATFNIADCAVAATHSTPSYSSPGTIAVTCQVSYPSDRQLLSLLWRPQLTNGWTVTGVSGNGNPEFVAGEIVWTGTIPASPISMVYTVSVASGQSGTQNIRGTLEYWCSGSPGTVSVPATPDPLPISQSTYHSADYSHDWVIGGSEINRVLAYWRAGGYYCDGSQPDGYAPGAGATGCNYHSADYADQRWQIGGSEVNRVLAYWRAGCYQSDASQPDGFAPGCTTGASLMAAVTEAVATAPTITQSGPSCYTTNSTMVMSNTFAYSGSLLSLLWRPQIPSGWSVISVSGSGNPELVAGEIVWTGAIPASPIAMVYTVQVAAVAGGAQEIRGQAEYWMSSALNVTNQWASPDPLSLSDCAVTCAYTINPTSANFPQTGGSASVGVMATNGCDWTATTTNDWIHLIPPFSGTNSGSVAYTVDANSLTSQRIGHIVVEDKTNTLTQTGMICTNVFYRDVDGDGYGSPTVTTQACAAPAGHVSNSSDCNDSNAAVHPGATEVCNGIDDDCDGQVDEGVTNTYYRDADGDGYGNPSISNQMCAAVAGWVSNSLDCNDNNPSAHPGATDVCNGVDDNCNGQIDEGVTTLYCRDADGDGYGNPSVTTNACSVPVGYTANCGDCNDDNANVYPGATDVCNGIDDNCNGQIDEGVKNTFYRDADGDGYGNPNMPQSACSAPAGYVSNSSDCNDSDGTVHPGVVENCSDGIDNDCDGLVDADDPNAVNCPVHDLAVTAIKAPKTVTLSTDKPSLTKLVKVQIQNRSLSNETITNYNDLVALAADSVGVCSNLEVVVHSGAPNKALPIVLAPKKKITIFFDVTFDCANDPLKGAGHEDFRYLAVVGQIPDTHPDDDECPRGALPGGVDPNPDGTIKDKGCGGKRLDGTLGADVLTDVVIKQ